MRINGNFVDLKRVWCAACVHQTWCTPPARGPSMLVHIFWRQLASSFWPQQNRESQVADCCGHHSITATVFFSTELGHNLALEPLCMLGPPDCRSNTSAAAELADFRKFLNLKKNTIFNEHPVSTLLIVLTFSFPLFLQIFLLLFFLPIQLLLFLFTLSFSCFTSSCCSSELGPRSLLPRLAWVYKLLSLSHLFFD